MRTSDKTMTIAAALYAVHRDLENPRKDAKGQVRGRADYRYLSLPALIDHAKVALKEAQVACMQDPHMVILPGNVPGIGVTTTFMHLTGEWIEFGPLAMPLPADPQQLGSATTYLRRYALAAALNLAADEDDDAASAKLEPGSTVTTEAAGMGAADGAGSAAYGEGAAGPAPPTSEEAASAGPSRSTSEPAPSSSDPHPGIDHKLGPAGNPEYARRGVKQCRIRGCDYVFWPAGLEPTSEGAA